MFRSDAPQHTSAVRQSRSARHLTLVGRSGCCRWAGVRLEDAVAAVPGANRIESVHDRIERAFVVVAAEAPRAGIAILAMAMCSAFRTHFSIFHVVPRAVGGRAVAVTVVATFGSFVELTIAAAPVLHLTVAAVDPVAKAVFITEGASAFVVQVGALRIAAALDTIVNAANAGCAIVALATSTVVIRSKRAAILVDATTRLLEKLAVAADPGEARAVARPSVRQWHAGGGAGFANA